MTAGNVQFSSNNNINPSATDAKIYNGLQLTSAQENQALIDGNASLLLAQALTAVNSQLKSDGIINPTDEEINNKINDYFKKDGGFTKVLQAKIDSARGANNLIAQDQEPVAWLNQILQEKSDGNLISTDDLEKITDQLYTSAGKKLSSLNTADGGGIIVINGK